MKKITVLCIIACILAFSACLCSCSHDNKPPTDTIEGKYYRYTASGIDEECCFEFKSDKTFIDWKSNQGSYSLDGNKLTLQYDYDEKAIAYIRDDVLYFYGEYYCKSGISSPYKEYGELTYVLNEDGFYSIIGVTNKEITSVVIPAKINNVTVTGLIETFKDCNQLTEVVIPDCITTIEGAFYGCSSLKNVTLPNSLTTIGSYAFYNCIELTIVDLPDSVTIIGYSAFEGCRNLTEIIIPDNVTTIGEYAFYDCVNAKSLSLGKNIALMGYSTFALCGLESISIPSTNTKYYVDNNCLIEKATKTLVLGCSTSIIPSDGSVTSIGTEAFCGRHNLTSINIPNTITYIGTEAFPIWLESIIYDGTIAQWKEIEKEFDWDYNTGDYTITCTDGTINKGEM